MIIGVLSLRLKPECFDPQTGQRFVFCARGPRDCTDIYSFLAGTY